MVRREHCGIVYRATRSRCESRDDAVFPPMPTRCRIPLVRRLRAASLQDLLDRAPPKVEHSPADSSAEVRCDTYGTCASNCRASRTKREGT